MIDNVFAISSNVLQNGAELISGVIGNVVYLINQVLGAF